MRIACLTPTNGRPESLQLCCRHVREQTVINDHLIAEGGTLEENLTRLIDRAAGKYDAYAIIEDDDFYHPEYLQELKLLFQDNRDIAAGGFGYTCCYHLVFNKFGKEMHPGRCSLHGTILREDGLEHLREVLEGPRSRRHIDMELFSRDFPRATMEHHYASDGRRLLVSLKGVIGTPGISSQHSPDRSLYTGNSVQGKVLDEWIGEEMAGLYRSITRSKR